MARGSRYTAAQRSEAVALSHEIGVTRACERLNIPSTTLYVWRLAAKTSNRDQQTSSETPKRFTNAQRAEMVALSYEIGVTAACKRFGVSQSSLYEWRAQAKATKSSIQNDDKTEGMVDVAVTAENESGVSRNEQQTADRSGDTSSRSTKVARRYTPSEKAQALEYMAEHGASAAAQKFGVTRCSLYDWKRKVERAARGEGDSPTSGPDPKDIEAQRDAEILAMWKKHPGLGPSQIRNQLRRQGVKVSVKVVQNIMYDAGYRPPGSKRVPHDERFEAVRPNHLWHFDFVQRFVNRCSVFTLILIDDHSRFVVGHCATDTERADPVIHCFEEAVQHHGRPEMVLHDKGSAFWSWKGVSRFTQLLVEMGIDQIPAQFKEWNGKLECFNANIQKEFFNAQRFYDVSEMRRQLNGHLHWYNHQRTHHALGGIFVPADRYYGREEEVRDLMAAGAGNMLDLHTISLGERTMDIFRVVQRGDETEIWLMGQKLATFGK